MEWNRKGAQRKASHEDRVYVDFDPAYTLDGKFLCKIFNWSRGTLHKRMKLRGFPQPKHFGQKHVRWHPQHVNDWLVARDGKYD